MLSNLRFDNSHTRDEQIECDKKAAGSSMWDSFINICQSLYLPGEYLTVYEMLMPLHARCSFKMYMLENTEYKIKVCVKI